jgi:hypothetical protein
LVVRRRGCDRRLHVTVLLVVICAIMASGSDGVRGHEGLLWVVHVAVPVTRTRVRRSQGV